MAQQAPGLTRMIGVWGYPKQRAFRRVIPLGNTTPALAAYYAGVMKNPAHSANMRALAAEHVKVIFSETQEAGSRLVRRFAQDAGVPMAVLDTLETGALAPGTYEEGMRRNLRVLEEHLEIQNPKSEIRKNP